MVSSWTPTYGNTNVDWLAKTLIYQLCGNTGCHLEELTRAREQMARESQRNLSCQHTLIMIYIYIYTHTYTLQLAYFLVDLPLSLCVWKFPAFFLWKLKTENSFSTQKFYTHPYIYIYIYIYIIYIHTHTHALFFYTIIWCKRSNIFKTEIIMKKRRW